MDELKPLPCLLSEEREVKPLCKLEEKTSSVCTVQQITNLKVSTKS
jgi:hypothetical protein